MAIVNYTGTYPNQEIFNTEHVGCVIKSETRDYRAMSDVYTTADYALVWLPEEEDTKWIRVNINYMGCDMVGVITKARYAEPSRGVRFPKEPRE